MCLLLTSLPSSYPQIAWFWDWMCLIIATDCFCAADPAQTYEPLSVQASGMSNEMAKRKSVPAEKMWGVVGCDRIFDWSMFRW